MAVAAIDMTDIETVRRWANVKAETTDDLLQQLITAASRFILNYLATDSILTRSLTEQYDGNGNAVLLLRQWPATAVASVAFGSTTLAAAAGTPPSNGFVLEPVCPAGGRQKLTLLGWRYPRGQIVTVAYTAGFAAVPEDLSEACMELVGIRYKEREHIGLTSVSMNGQQTVGYSQKDLSDWVRSTLDRYDNTVPG